jgi:hypothetical protein
VKVDLVPVTAWAATGRTALVSVVMPMMDIRIVQVSVLNRFVYVSVGMRPLAIPAMCASSWVSPKNCKGQIMRSSLIQIERHRCSETRDRSYQ